MQTYWLQAVTALTNSPLPGAKLIVYATGTTSKASLFDTTGSPIANPMTADPNGVAQFQVPDGTYDIIASSGLYVGPTRAQVQIYDASNFINIAYFNANGSAQFNFTTAVAAATTTTLPANTYANGTLGVGATLTGNANGALSAQDGVTLSVNQRLWVKNEAAPANNGIYALTTVGSGGAPYILTRTTDANTAALLARIAATVSGGSVNIGLAYGISLTQANITVGTTALTPVLAPGGATTTAPAGTLTGATLAANVVASSLTSLGILTGLTVVADANINNQTLGLGGGAIGSNTVFGFQAFDANTSGINSVALGEWTLQHNTSGYDNVAIGPTAMQFNTSGFQCIAIGYASLQANIDGLENVAVGVNSLLANTHGQANNAVGFASLAANTTGNSNCAFGAACLPSNTTGSNNLAAGQQAMAGNTIGNLNVGLGFQALFNNQQGSSNVGVGESASYNLATPSSGPLSVASSFNVAVGAHALYDLGFPSIAATATVNGNSYTIFSVGTTNWTLIGAASNTVGVTFTATGAGAGTGVAFANIATNNNSALGYNTGRGIVYGINNTILGAQVTGLAAGLSGAIILASGDGVIHLDYANSNAATWTFKQPAALPSSTVAALPAAGIAGRIAYANNLRVFNGTGTQQGSGVGTGGLVVDNGSHWVNADAQSVTAVA